jgi:hypothetical protein
MCFSLPDRKIELEIVPVCPRIYAMDLDHRKLMRSFTEISRATASTYISALLT